MALQRTLVIGEKFTPSVLINPSVTLAHAPVGNIAVYAGAIGALSRIDASKFVVTGAVVAMVMTLVSGNVIVVDYQY